MDDNSGYPLTPEPERVVDAEVVGRPRPAPLWKRVLGRAAGAIVLGAAGLFLAVVGAVLTISIIGAAIGLPLLALGLLLMLAAAFLALGGGKIRVISGRG